MTFLPIVERELRVRARLKSTHRFRLFAAIGAIGVVGILLISVNTLSSAGQFGGVVFGALAWLSFAYCLLDGARNTADCLSSEKRSGTLGLLFLTDLRPYDVVLGKLMATSLNSFYGLLAIFPPLAIPLVIGGVTVGEFWRLILVLMNTLFLSVTIGLAVSSACRDERRAWSAAVLLLLFFASVPPLLLLTPSLSSSFAASLSPTTGFLNVFDAAYSRTTDTYWSSLWSVQALGWAFLITAMFVLPRAWQDRPQSGNGSWWQRMTRRITGRRENGHDEFEERSLVLDGNPVVWLVVRGGGQQTLLWTLVIGASLVVGAAWFVSSGGTTMAFVIFGVMVLVHMTLAAAVASEACHLFAGARDSGALELLLCTPVTAKEVVEGHMLGLRNMFYRPVAVLLSIEGLLLAAQIYVLGAGGMSPVGCTLIAFAVGLCLLGAVMDLVAVARYGMWQGLVNNKPSRALTRTVLYVLVLPLMASMLCTWGFLLPLIWPLKNLVYLNYAREQMRRQFRGALAERYGWAEESEFIGQASNRPRTRRLPPMLPR